MFCELAGFGLMLLALATGSAANSGNSPAITEADVPVAIAMAEPVTAA